MALSNLNAEMISEYVDKYFGNGGWDSRYWCIGIEPKPSVDNPNLEQLTRTIQVWDSLGRSNFNDVLLYWITYQAPNPLFNGGNHPILRRYIKLILPSVYSKPYNRITDVEINTYREKSFLRDDITTLIDLFPLPCKSTDDIDWQYAPTSVQFNIPFLATRSLYLNHVNQIRQQILTQRIITHQPKSIICMSLSYSDIIQSILPYGTDIGFLRTFAGLNYYYTTIEHPNKQITRVLIMHQPGRSGNNSYWEHLSTLI